MAAEGLFLVLTTALSTVAWITHRREQNWVVRRSIITARLAFYTSVGAFLAACIVAFTVVDAGLSDEFARMGSRSCRAS